MANRKADLGLANMILRDFRGLRFKVRHALLRP